MAWRYFTDMEMGCSHCGKIKMDESFMELLDSLRRIVGNPLVVNSGYRCPTYDLSIGGEGNHPTGKAVDLSVTDSAQRYAILLAAIQLGFTRIGVAKTFIHLDLVSDHPQRVIWIY